MIQRALQPKTWVRPQSTSEDFFDLLHRVQASRIDDQRCSLPSKTNKKPESQIRLEKQLRELSPGQYTVSLPADGSWKIDILENEADTDAILEEVSQVYRAHFLRTDHFNFLGQVKILLKPLK